MKKKIITLLMTAVLVISMTACGKTVEEPETITSVSTVTSVSKEVAPVSKETASVSTSVSKNEPVTEEIIKEGLVTEAPKKYDYSVVVTINPTITLYVVDNENGEAIVDSFKFDNRDAEVAYKDLELANIKADEAVKLIIKTASEKEYLKDDGNVTIDVQPFGDVLPLAVVESYKEVASATVTELNKHGEIIVHNYDSEGKEIVAEEKKKEKKEAKVEEKKEAKSSVAPKKEETKTEAKKTETKTSTPASTPAGTPASTPAPAPQPEIKKVCDMNHNSCDNPNPDWGHEEYTITVTDRREEHGDGSYTIWHSFHYTDGRIKCLNCGGYRPLLSYDAEDGAYDIYGEGWDEIGKYNYHIHAPNRISEPTVTKEYYYYNPTTTPEPDPEPQPEPTPSPEPEPTPDPSGETGE